MKLFILIFICLMVTTYVFGFKYTKIEVYNLYDDNCSLQPYEIVYQLNGWCVDGNTNIECNQDGTVVTQNVFSTNSGCKGAKIGNITNASGTCAFENVVYSCVDDFEIPENTLVSVVTNGKCENDPSWKDDIGLIGYEYLDQCIQNYKGAFELTCNSSIPYKNIYNSTSVCNTVPTGYGWFSPNECSKNDPTFYYCNV
ncbi:hypothetical protein ACTFIR_009556 [Dictyostelium discoideum]